MERCVDNVSERNRRQCTQITTYSVMPVNARRNTWRYRNNRALILAGLLALVGVFSMPIAAEAACQAYPRFTPSSGRATNEAWEAEQFVRSIGVNLHIGSGRYASEFNSMIKPRLLEAGFRTVRTNAGDINAQPDHIRQLGQAGIRLTLVTDAKTNLDKIVAGIKAIGPNYIASVEGINEPESRSGCDDKQLCWVKPTRDHQMRLYKTLKSDPSLRNILVLGPSLKTQNLDFSPRMLGNIDSYMDGFSIHRYAGPEVYPENSLYFSKLNLLFQYASASNPAFITETGYSTSNTSEALGSDLYAETVPQQL